MLPQSLNPRYALVNLTLNLSPSKQPAQTWPCCFHPLGAIKHREGRRTLALVRQNIVEALYLYAWLENGLELWNGLEWTVEFTFIIAILNSTV